MNRKIAWLSAGLLGIITAAALVIVIARQAPDASPKVVGSGSPSILSQISQVAHVVSGSVSDSKDATARVRIGALDCAGLGRSSGGSQVEKLYDCDFKSSNAPPKEAGKAALAVLKEAAPELGLEQKDSSLDLLKKTTAKGVTHVRFSQSFKGLPVFGSHIAVHTEKKSGRVLLVDSDVLQTIEIPDIRPSINSQKALASAAAVLDPKSKPFRTPSAELGVYPVAGKVGVLAWKTVTPLAKPFGIWEVMVDAGSGMVIDKRNLALGVDGLGRVYEPNPIVSGSTTLFTDNNDSDSFSLNNQRNLRTFRDLDDSWAMDSDGDLVVDAQPLRGLWAAGIGPGKAAHPKGTRSEALAPISEADDEFNPLDCPSAPCFSFPRSDDRFEESNAYYHVTESQLYLQSLGFGSIRHRVTTANVNQEIAGQQVMNAWYDPTLDELFFGGLGVDAAEDADVINHEYGHAIQADQVPGFPADEEAAAIGEGFGDYFAFRRHGAYAVGPYGRECIAAWFSKSLPGSNCLRRIDGSRVYPGNVVYEEHEDGNIWSRGLLDLYKKLGGTIADTLIIDSHNYMNPDATFSEAVQAMVRSDRLLYPNGSGAGLHEDSIVDTFALRGIYPRPFDLDVPDAVIDASGDAVLTSGIPTNVSWDRWGTPTAAYQLEYAESAGASGTWTEDFEDGWISPVSWDLSYPAWFASSKWSKSGRFAARAARMAHGQYAVMHQTQYVTTKGTVEFDYRVSSEARTGMKSGDNLYFRACGSSGCIQLGSWSGRTQGHFKVANLNSGWWVFSWYYSKDHSVSKGSDTAYIDNIKIGTVPTPDWKPLSTLIPAGSDTYNWNAPLTPGYDYTLRIRGIARGSYTPWTYGPIFEVEEP